MNNYRCETCGTEFEYDGKSLLYCPYCNEDYFISYIEVNDV